MFAHHGAKDVRPAGEFCVLEQALRCTSVGLGARGWGWVGWGSVTQGGMVSGHLTHGGVVVAGDAYYSSQVCLSQRADPVSMND